MHVGVLCDVAFLRTAFGSAVSERALSSCMQIALKWFPPSWIQITAEDSVIYIDPAYLRTYFLHYPKRIDFSRWPDPIDGLPEQLPAADIILITHQHKDHLKSVTIRRLMKKETIILAPRSCAKELGENMTAIEAGNARTLRGFQITAVDAYNTVEGHSTKKNHRRGKGLGYVLRAGTKSIYHAGDTDLIPEMASLGRVDVALLPIGGTFTMDREEAVRASLMIKPQYVVPIHHLKENACAFVKELSRKSRIRAKVLRIGEVFLI
jgi:L-ascorbate metabolism protein UlaG (beta-lactamase superfamily)